MRIVIVLIVIVILLCVLWLLAGLAGFTASMGRGKPLDLSDRDKLSGTSWDRYYDEITAGMRWIESQPRETVTVTAHDGLTLYADLIRHPQARGTFIAFHGYRTFAACDFSADSDHYYSMGYHLLLVDQRGCGRSSGKYITFGIKERMDCLDWIRYVQTHLTENQEIFLGGLSLGASTVLMASGQPLPPEVRGIVADSAFTTPKEIIGRTIRNKYHLPDRLLLPVIDLWSRLLAGVTLDEYSTLQAMETNQTPILFVHGKDDDYVPWEMTVRTYEKCRSKKTLYLVENAVHGVAYMIEPENYRRQLTNFFEACRNNP